MQIDISRLKEYGIKEQFIRYDRLVADDERFYNIPHYCEYVFSTYGRLKRINFDSGLYLLVKPTWRYNDGDESYKMFDDDGNKHIITVEKLLIMVFLPWLDPETTHLTNQHGGSWVHPKFADVLPFSLIADASNFYTRWRIEDMYILTSKNDEKESVISKLSHREPEFPDDQRGNVFIGRRNVDTRIKAKIHTDYTNMMTRKRTNPSYQDKVIFQLWLESEAAYAEYWLEIQYEYTGPYGELSIDKDLKAIDKDIKGYLPSTLCHLPIKLNEIFRKARSKFGYGIQRKSYKKSGKTLYTFTDTAGIEISTEDYQEALRICRHIKAQQLRNIIAFEQQRGEIPQDILYYMSLWADKCEAGEIEEWEPSEEIIKECEGYTNNE